MKKTSFVLGFFFIHGVTFIPCTNKKNHKDNDWKITSKGPIIANNEYDGEEYDARKELTDCKTDDYDDSSWKNIL